MGQKEILDYVMDNPGNTNYNVLAPMLDAIDSSNLVKTFTFGMRINEGATITAKSVEFADANGEIAKKTISDKGTKVDTLSPLMLVEIKGTNTGNGDKTSISFTGADGYLNATESEAGSYTFTGGLKCTSDSVTIVIDYTAE